ncbi:hypothetical protein EDB83DRAFT_2553553 [Lactarius deliciosus]|nr:hypothetical protein EDB83DRAFT_2553553 [Lactarius deliciosus]
MPTPAIIPTTGILAVIQRPSPLVTSSSRHRRGCVVAVTAVTVAVGISVGVAVTWSGGWSSSEELGCTQSGSVLSSEVLAGAEGDLWRASLGGGSRDERTMVATAVPLVRMQTIPVRQPPLHQENEAFPLNLSGLDMADKRELVTLQVQRGNHHASGVSPSWDIEYLSSLDIPHEANAPTTHRQTLGTVARLVNTKAQRRLRCKVN